MTTILLVDDDIDHRGMAASILEREGYSVILAKDGFEGLRVFGNHKDVDLIITDLMMPDMEGIEFIVKIKERSPGTKIIAISGGSKFSNVSFLNIAAELGAQETLPKPFTHDALLDVVKGVLESQ